MVEQAVVHGGCNCGAVRYEVQMPATMSVHCHCRQCQRESGGPMITMVAFPEAAFRTTDGAPKSYEYRGESGSPVARYFCADCGSSLYGKPTIFPGMLFVSAPSLDDPGWVKPELHGFMGSAQSWDPTDEVLPRFDKLPPA